MASNPADRPLDLRLDVDHGGWDVDPVGGPDTKGVHELRRPGPSPGTVRDTRRRARDYMR
ncbi:hypothetical protein [Catenulispora pinisilvae]|uniref:hypothetical protein n=1 Tax=Catenulispora pinisilvae TaxID=2705253 RepID=UPI001E30E0EB|nr:hypothetical protein [Catenulispora pinisilvae]